MFALFALLTITNAFNVGETIPSASTLVESHFRENKDKMTLETALISIGKELPYEVMELLKSGNNKKANLRAAVGLLQDEKKRKGSGWTTEELDRAIEILNKMYDQEQADLDVVLIDCTKFENTMTEQLTENARVRTMMAAETDEATAQKLEAKKVQKETSAAIEGLNEEYDEHKQACDSTLTAARAQLAIAEFDLKVALKIQEQAECDDAAIAEAVDLENAAAEKEDARLAAKETAVLTQKKSKAGKQFTVSECMFSGSSQGSDDDASRLEFGGEMEQYASQFKSKESWWAMQRAAKMALSRDLGKHSFDHHHQKYWHPSHAVSSFAQTGTSTTTEDLLSMSPEVDLSAMGGAEEEPMKAGSSADAAAAFKCNVNAVPNCPLLSDAISVMVSEIRGTYNEIKGYVEETQAHCDELSAEFESQIKTNEGQFDEAGVTLVEAGKVIATNQFKTEAKVKEHEGLASELEAKQKECAANILALQETMCGIKIVRLELLQMAEDARIPADCEVGDWIPDECSASCEGGVQTMNRAVVTEPNFGSACPPLSMEQACNEFPCPVDCVMEMWTGWSACTKDCGGGSTNRARNVITKPLYKGKECEETTEIKGCNDDSCNADCVLADWTEWGSCSKSCRGDQQKGMDAPVPGIQTQIRAEISPARGTGICDDVHGPLRFGQMPCNDEVCPDNVVCNAKLDIMLLFDASGSVGSRGFDSEKQFGHDLVKRININEDMAKVGVVKYSSKVEIALPMTFDFAAVESTVTGLTWDARTTSTSTALSYARDALVAGGREGVDSVVFIITDGMPNDSDATSKMAEEIKKVATLKFVVVGKNLDMEMIHMWASFPPEQNVFRTKKFKKLDNQITEFISGMCPSLECRETQTGTGEDYNGCQDVTESGVTCQAWGEKKPHKVPEIKEHKDLKKLNNFCRNPGGAKERIWCYTTDPLIPWEYCNPRTTTDIK